MVYTARQHCLVALDKQIEPTVLPYLNCSASIEMLSARADDIQIKLMRHLPVPMVVLQNGHISYQNLAFSNLFEKQLSAIPAENDRNAVESCPVHQLTSLLTPTDEETNSLLSNVSKMEKTLDTRNLSPDQYSSLLDRSEKIGVYKHQGKKYSIISQVIEWNENCALLLVLEAVFEDPLFTLADAESDLLKVVAHDLRNPLTSLSLTMESIRRSLKDHELEEQIRTAKASSDMILSLSEDVLDFMQAQNGNLRITEDFFSPLALAHSVKDMLGFKASSKNIILEVHSEVPECYQIRNDKNRIRQVLVNLTSNAIKFSGSDEKVVIGIKKDNNGRAPVRFFVRDRGIGMSEDEQKGLTEEEFYKSPSQESIARNPNGVGLGLVISQRIANIVGTGIDIESKQGNGSTFSFGVYVPDSRKFHSAQALLKMSSYDTDFFDEMTQSERSPSAEMPEREFKVNSTSPGSMTRRSNSEKFGKTKSLARVLPPSGNKRSVQASLLTNHLEEDQKAGPADILVIDDAEFCQISMKTMFKLFHKNIEVAWNGQEGLQKVKARAKLPIKQYKGIFIDQNMPGMLGEECAKAIRQLPGGKEIFLFGFSGENDDWSDRSLFNDFLSKPFERNGFTEIIKKYNLA